jgi:hypothetical protein
MGTPRDTISLESFSDNYPCEQEVDEEGGQAIFFAPEAEEDSLPDSDSPLADYYVPTSRVLKDDPDTILEPWGVPLVTLAGALVATLLILYVFRRKRGTERIVSIEPGTDDSGDAATNPNKDKMLATVVLDMRMNTRGLQAATDVLAERSSETDVSLTDTEGSGARVRDNRSLEDIQPAEIETPASVATMRRRNVPDHR